MQNFNSLLGIRFRGFFDNVYHLELATGPKHLQQAGNVHGGVYLSLLDTVMARAVQSHFEGRYFAPTMNLSGNFFRPFSEGLILAEGRVVNSSRRTVYAEGKLFGEDNSLLALGSATFLFSGELP